MGEERKQPRFSQFALAAARDTSAFDTKTVQPEGPSPAEAEASPVPAQEGEASPQGEQTRLAAIDGGPRAAPRAPRAARPSAAAELADEELVSFTVRLPASLYMRMRRSLGLREKLGELCVAAITRELDLRR